MAHGTALALPLHFHQEDQLTYILSGCRHFYIADQKITLTKGQALHIPAGTPHFSRDEATSLSPHQQTFCLNLYLLPHVLTEIADYAALIQHYSAQKPASILTVPSSTPLLPLGESLPAYSIQSLARQAHLSREAFSRRFHRQHGITPRSFQLLQRLNYAKKQLRAGMSSTEAAMDSGFADQSHMGRLFRRTFGTTPCRYQRDPTFSTGQDQKLTRKPYNL